MPEVLQSLKSSIIQFFWGILRLQESFSQAVSDCCDDPDFSSFLYPSFLPHNLIVSYTEIRVTCLITWHRVWHVICSFCISLCTEFCSLEPLLSSWEHAQTNLLKDERCMEHSQITKGVPAKTILNQPTSSYCEWAYNIKDHHMWMSRAKTRNTD